MATAKTQQPKGIDLYKKEDLGYGYSLSFQKNLKGECRAVIRDPKGEIFVKGPTMLSAEYAMRSKTDVLTNNVWIKRFYELGQKEPRNLRPGFAPERPAEPEHEDEPADEDEDGDY